MLSFANPHFPVCHAHKGSIQNQGTPTRGRKKLQFISRATKLSSIPPPKKKRLSWTPLPGKKKECPLFSGEQWGSPCQQLRAESQQGLLPACRHLGLRKNPHCLQGGWRKVGMKSHPHRLYQKEISEGLYRSSLIVQVTPRYFLPTTLSRQGPTLQLKLTSNSNSSFPL